MNKNNSNDGSNTRDSKEESHAHPSKEDQLTDQLFASLSEGFFTVVESYHQAPINDQSINSYQSINNVSGLDANLKTNSVSLNGLFDVVKDSSAKNINELLSIHNESLEYDLLKQVPEQKIYSIIHKNTQPINQTQIDVKKISETQFTSIDNKPTQVYVDDLTKKEQQTLTINTKIILNDAKEDELNKK
jgi:hypothetical protein